MTDSKAREAAARTMTVALKNAADQVYWWDEADRQIIGGGEPEWTEYAGGVKLADRFDMQAIANAAIDAYIAALGETHAIVPREPTEAMLWSFNFVAVDKYNHRNLSQAFAQEVYRAMLNAAEPKRSEQT